MPDEGTQATEAEAAAAKEAADKAEADRIAAEEAAGKDDDGEKDMPEGVKTALAAARKAERDARAAARDASKRAETAEAQLKERQEAELSELERAQNRAKELEEQAEAATKRERDSAVRYEVAIHANKLNLHDADTAHALIDLEKVEFDDAGRPTNVEDLIKALVKDKPFLVKTKGGGIEPTPEADSRGITDASLQAARADTKARTSRWF